MKIRIVSLFIVVVILINCYGVQNAFADEITQNERIEIIEAAKRGWMIYETIGGMTGVATVILAENGWVWYNTDSAFGIRQDGSYELDVNYENVKDYDLEYKCLSEIADPESKLYMFPESEGTFYIKTRFQNESELEQYIDSIFLGNSFDVEAWNKHIGHDRIVEKNGNVYLITTYALPAIIPVEFDFDSADIKVVGNTATVTMKLTDIYKMMISANTDPSRTIILKKDSGNWKICGGSAFMANIDEEIEGIRNDWYEMLYSDEYPQTGDTSVLHITIAAASLAVMASMVVKRKKRRIAE